MEFLLVFKRWFFLFCVVFELYFYFYKVWVVVLIICLLCIFVFSSINCENFDKFILIVVIFFFILSGERISIFVRLIINREIVCVFIEMMFWIWRLIFRLIVVIYIFY